MKMKLLGQEIELSEDYLPVKSLKFLKENPRVYAVTHAERRFEELAEEQQQGIILEKLRMEKSFKNLLPEVKRHGGLIEPILVRTDRMEVIEGNSRLAVYLHLHEQQPDGDWELIPCHLITGLTPTQQAAFLNQIHVKGKTEWSSYEKANFAYVRKMGGMNVDDIARLFGESRETIRKRIDVIKLMEESEDSNRRHFSYYEVLVQKAEIWKEIKGDNPLRDRVVESIRTLSSDSEEEDFTAIDLRRKLPAVIKKPKILQRFVNRKIDLEDAYQRAKVSRAEERVKRALSLLDVISIKDVSDLDSNSLNSLRQAVKKLTREVTRIHRMTAREESK